LEEVLDMLTQVENERLTRVGPGTPGGEWLRRYWHPIAISEQGDFIRTHWDFDEPLTFQGEPGTVGSWADRLGNFKGKPTAVRILGEDLVLFRDGSGRPGLIGRYCPHRNASLEYGRIESRGIACCYHGWLFDVKGNCLAQPAEPADSNFKDKATAYPVQEMGGFLWGYLGPGEPPVLPRYDIFARTDGVRAVENFGLMPCNYLQICENSVDQAHTGILHGGGGGERSDIWGTELPKTSWETAELGIKSTAIREGMKYKRQSYYVFPAMHRLPQPWPGGKFRWPRFSALIRTPVDDTHTMTFSVCFTPEVDGKLPELPPGMDFHITDQLLVHRTQDYEAIGSQGPIADRTNERLGTSDGGVILLRKLISEGIGDVEAGRDPRGVLLSNTDAFIDLEQVVADDLNRMVPA
jgi:nitrite reductase/ring-hydroxylating ferredoxin subunit